MNNGRYFQIMDVARFGWLIRTGTVKVLSANKWSAFLGGGQMRFRKALKLLERFSVTTRLLSWDENWYFLEHRFHNAGGKLVAMGVVRAAFRGGKGWVKTSLSMPLIDGDRQPPPLGEGIQRWLDAEELLVRQPGD
jgi:acyl-CoA thioesterase FadM